jgi:hypothetical protein
LNTRNPDGFIVDILIKLRRICSDESDNDDLIKVTLQQDDDDEYDKDGVKMIDKDDEDMLSVWLQ